MLQVDPDMLTAEYRTSILERLDMAVAVGVLGISVLVFLIAISVVRKL